MPEYSLHDLHISDGKEVFEMLQNICSNEYEFHNGVKGMSYEEFRKWLVTQVDWANGTNLPKGYVRQWTYWLYVDNEPVGYGKLREKLTDNSRILGGNIGYAISCIERGKGYGTILFRMLLNKAKEIGIETVFSTVEKENVCSRRIQEKCGGILVGENEHRWFFSFFN